MENHKEDGSTELKESFNQEIKSLSRTPVDLNQKSVIQSTAAKTPNDMRMSNTKLDIVKTRLFAADIKDNEKNNDANQDISRLSNENYIPNEADPSNGMFTLSNNIISHAPNESKKFNSFWKEKERNSSTASAGILYNLLNHEFSENKNKILIKSNLKNEN